MLLFTFNRPESREVRLAGQDVHVQHNYLTHEADAAMYVATCKEGIKFLDQPSMKALGDLEVLIPKALSDRFGTDLQSDALWEAWIRSYAQTIYHPVATCALNTVVDQECRVFQVDGLRVADASIMPDALSGNTQAACIMIGEKAADMIARQYGLHIS
ncbi:betA [Symbiodinium sp. CCMP2592]|nr:betA [Symbiodinium sp. CCMP2592]